MSILNPNSSLKSKLALRFGVLLAIFTIAMLVTFFILNNTITINNRIFSVYAPSIKKLENYKVNLINSKTLINSWVANQSDNNHPDKVKLKELVKEDLPALQKEIDAASIEWDKDAREKFGKIVLSVDSMNNDYKIIMNRLSGFDAYNDVMNMMELPLMVQDGGDIAVRYKKIISALDEVIASLNQNADNASSEMTDSLNKFKSLIILIIIITLAIGGLITFNTIHIITSPIKKVKEVLINMGKGILPDNALNTGEDEIGQMSLALNNLNDGLRKTAGYADRIGNGDMEATFEPLSEEDLLGNSLLEMGKKLKKLNEEDLKRNWAATGLAEFAQLLRENSNMQLLFDNIISKLVKTVGANQGALFLVNDDVNNVRLSMASCYAYNRKKFMQKEIEPGEGLVGQCYLEKDTIYLTDVPDKYTTITSGLGDATPSCLALFPLIVNDNLMGVIELASFKILDKYEIEFIKKVCENIAGTISNVKINQQTIKLLEESRIAQHNMKEQEEEMRQNLEELTATQEEMTRKERQFVLQIEELESRLNGKVH